MDKGRPAYTYNYFGLQRYTVKSHTKLTQEKADVGLDDATQVADLVFRDIEDSKFTGHVDKIVISIPEK